MTLEAQINKLQEDLTRWRENMQLNFFAVGVAMGNIDKKLNYLIEKEKEKGNDNKDK